MKRMVSVGSRAERSAGSLHADIEEIMCENEIEDQDQACADGRHQAVFHGVLDECVDHILRGFISREGLVVGELPTGPKRLDILVSLMRQLTTIIIPRVINTSQATLPPSQIMTDLRIYAIFSTSMPIATNWDTQ